MKKNLANWDRMLRLCGGVGAVLGATVWMQPGVLAYVVIGSGVVLVMTGAAARCPMCMVARMSTLQDKT